MKKWCACDLPDALVDRRKGFSSYTAAWQACGRGRRRRLPVSRQPEGSNSRVVFEECPDEMIMPTECAEGAPARSPHVSGKLSA